MDCINRAENCKNHLKIVGQIIFKKEKRKKMTWQLMWRNARAAALNAALQLLVISTKKFREREKGNLFFFFFFFVRENYA